MVLYYTRKHPADIELLLEIATETVSWVRIPHVYLNEGVGGVAKHGYWRIKCFRIMRLWGNK